MMEEMKLVPRRRVAGTVGNWTESKLGELSIFSKGKGYSKKDLRDSGHPLILYGRLYTNYETIINSVDTYTVKQENSVISKGGEVVVPSSGETKEDIARASVIAKANIILGGDLNIIKTSNKLDPVFLALSMSNGAPQKELIKLAQGSSVVHIYNEDLMNVTLYYPHIKEQQKIGEFFKVLDERIANQERKISKVKALKSAYLTEMFPQEGETVPKRRFKGFEGEWKTIKLGSIGTTFSGLSGKTKKDFGHGTAEFVTYMNVFSNTISDIKATEKVIRDDKQTQLKYGDLLFTTSSETPNEVGMSSVWLDDRSNVYLNSFCFGLRPSVYLDYYFMGYLLRAKIFRKQMKTLAQGISRYNISKNRVMEINIKLPSVKEQQKIGQFFKNLDNQITTKEKKLEKLKKMKEAYLEEMFV
ncbi:type I restriction enzyme S subunit [Gracilibacillus halotolerans]|uniref:Type I restriction enzyme S subunit n=1 Tax=Gracilibacillus halotolerans TaxID=74386 RepID=A0A841RLB2_9BACI|nr:restriction endonuclease subunit S [Gracilibacillus halotolerans]MBB6511528.1 type I restriction enzyme S subunit [Gracilibacillus halotolerans]